MEMTIKFIFDRDTKNTVRYLEDSDAPKIGTLYVQKLTFADGDYPRDLEVVLRAAEAPKSARARVKVAKTAVRTNGYRDAVLKGPVIKKVGKAKAKPAPKAKPRKPAKPTGPVTTRRLTAA